MRKRLRAAAELAAAVGCRGEPSAAHFAAPLKLLPGKNPSSGVRHCLGAEPSACPRVEPREGKMQNLFVRLGMLLGSPPKHLTSHKCPHFDL